MAGVSVTFELGLEAWCRLCGAEIEPDSLRPPDEGPEDVPCEDGVLMYLVKAGACPVCGSGRAAVWGHFGIADTATARSNVRRKAGWK